MSAPASGVLGPAVAGTFYPASSDALRSQVAELLGSAPPPSAGANVRALIAPHAGYVYSGAVAAAGFRELRSRQFDRVLLIGPSHYEAFPGGAVPEATRYRTPLGEVALDRGAIERLATCDAIDRSDRPFWPEHSLETEIPFLQQTLEHGWQLMPLLIGAGSTPATRSVVAESLRPWVDARSLIVVSSDFTHYGARFGYVPFETDVAARIHELDMGALAPVLARDAAAFRAYVDRTGATICGHGAIDVLLQLLPADTSARLVAYDTSGRMTGDWEHTVSYASVAWDVAESAG